jgi:hypothetical protein
MDGAALDDGAGLAVQAAAAVFAEGEPVAEPFIPFIRSLAAFANPVGSGDKRSAGDGRPDGRL